MTKPGATTCQDADSPTAAGRYAWIQYPWVREVPLGGSVPLQECWPAFIRDLSAGKVCLILRRELPVGGDVGLDLVNAAQNCTRRLRGRIVDAQPMSNQPRGGQWLLTCKFCEPLSAADLQALSA